MILTKSASEKTSDKDGLRIFVTRLWPRGHRREECDEWMPNLGPSEKLLRQIQREEISWSVFEKEYKQEMLHGISDESAKNPRMKNSGQKYVIRLLKKLAEKQTVTLICTCPADAEHCHRFVLKRLVEKG